MKSQIALLGIGVVIAAGVAYIELKPAAETQIAPVVAATASSTPTKAVVEPTTPAPKKTVAPLIPKPTISGSDDEEDEEDEDDHDDEDDEDEEDDD
jgi:hypothetical protein